MTGWRRILSLLVIGATIGPAAAADGYPVAEIVQYVEVCMRDRDGTRQELIYKCSCVMENLATALKYDEFIDGLTASRASSVAGERGSTMRDSDDVQKRAREFRLLEAKARRQCFLP